jgi:hypothetical protein
MEKLAEQLPRNMQSEWTELSFLQKQASKVERYERMRALRDAGFTVLDIAEIVGATRPTVYRYLALGGPPERQRPQRSTRRVLAPYEFGVIEEPRDWSWNETGVCHYCAHCNLALSTIPAERWGHPVRTVDPPLWRGEDDPLTVKKCQWTVWKSLEAIPEREYERIGRTKPPLPVIQPGATAPGEGQGA